MSSDDETITGIEAALKKAKADKIAKVERRVAEEHRIAEAKAVEVRAAKEHWAVEARAEEEERSRAQAEALRQQKLLAALEVKWKAEEMASGSGLGPRGGPKNVGAPEKGKGVEQASCDRCMARRVICKVSLFLGFRSNSVLGAYMHHTLNTSLIYFNTYSIHSSFHQNIQNYSKIFFLIFLYFYSFVRVSFHFFCSMYCTKVCLLLLS